jgi:hypothetical protein
VIAAGPRDEVGERLVRAFLGIWDDPVAREPFLALLRSAVTNDTAARLFREFLTSALLDHLGQALEVPADRIATAEAQVVGLVLLRYVLRLEPLASAGVEQVVRLVGPTINRYLADEA